MRTYVLKFGIEYSQFLFRFFPFICLSFIIVARQNHVIAIDVKSFTYCCYVRCATMIVRVGGMPWSKTYYNAQLGLPDKGRTIKVLVICYVVWL